MGRARSMYSAYLAVALVRGANAVFIVSLAITYSEFTAEMVGVLLASYSITEALSGFLAGIIYEILGTKFSLMISSAMLALIYTTMSRVSLFYELVVLNAIAGFSAAMILVSSLSAIAEETRGFGTARRVFGVGGFEASNLGGYSMGFAIAGALEVLGLLKGFYISALMASISALTGFLARNVRSSASNHLRDLYVIERRALVLIPTWLGLAMILGVGFLSPKILRELNLGVSVPLVGNISSSGVDGAIESIGSNPSIGLLLIVILIGVAIGIILGSIITAKIGKERALVIGSISLSASLVMIGLTYENLVLFLPIILAIATPALTIPPTLLALFADYTDESRRRGPSAGVYVTVLGIGIGLGEIIGGKIFDALGLEVLAFTLAAIFIVLSIPTSIYVLRETGSKARYING